MGINIKYKNKIITAFLVSILAIFSFAPIINADCGCNNFVDESYEESYENLCGLVEPENWREDAVFDPCNPKGDLPDAFDWRDSYDLPQVRNQGSCGSCWAFSTVGPLECNIKIKEGIDVDLSEQWLVSCTNAGSCGGGWYAHEYHQYAGDYCGDSGAVLEEHFPYVAYNAPCNCPYPHDYFIDSWAYIGNQYSVPSVGQIKQAIMDYGPVSVGVAVNSAFSEYDGGIFSGPHSSDLNHAVVLVGWDDNQGSDGVWFLRNSWGSGWGEGGYMRIEYGVSYVGYAACYVDYIPNPKLSFNFPEGLPEYLIPGEQTDLIVQIEEIDDVYVPGTATLHYRYDDGGFSSSPLTRISGDLFEATLPPAYYGDEPEFYFTAEGETGGVSYSPVGAPDTVHTAPLARPDIDLELRDGLYAGAKISNSGPYKAENVSWYIKIRGGLLNAIRLNISGGIDEIEPDDDEIISTGVAGFTRLLFGFGKVDISIIVEPENGNKKTKNSDGIVIFGIVKIND